MAKTQKIKFAQVLDALRNEDELFPPTYLHRFSDLSKDELQTLLAAWPAVGLNRRRALLEDLEILAEADSLLSFDDLAEALLSDSDSVIRMLAIRLLWQSDNARLVPRFLQILRTDEDYFTRSAAATALGRFIYLGEVGELDADVLDSVEEGLLNAWATDSQKLVRRRALESLGYSSRPEVPGLIEQAAGRENDVEWLASALFAMGRSGDDERWGQQVLQHLEHYDTDVRLEAIRAAGELGLAAARLPLLRQLRDEDDEDLRDALIWALSQIGGDGVRARLESLYDAAEADSEDESFLRDALDNLDFTEDVLHFEMFEFDPDKSPLRNFDPDDQDDDLEESWGDDWLDGVEDDLFDDWDDEEDPADDEF